MTRRQKEIKKNLCHLKLFRFSSEIFLRRLQKRISIHFPVIAELFSMNNFHLFVLLNVWMFKLFLRRPGWISFKGLFEHFFPFFGCVTILFREKQFDDFCDSFNEVQLFTVRLCGPMNLLRNQLKIEISNQAQSCGTTVSVSKLPFCGGCCYKPWLIAKRNCWAFITNPNFYLTQNAACRPDRFLFITEIKLRFSGNSKINRRRWRRHGVRNYHRLTTL